MVTIYNLTVRPTAEDATSYGTEHGEIELALIWKLSPYWLAFTGLEVLYTPLERNNHQSYPVTNPMSYSTDLPVRQPTGARVVRALGELPTTF